MILLFVFYTCLVQTRHNGILRKCVIMFLFSFEAFITLQDINLANVTFGLDVCSEGLWSDQTWLVSVQSGEHCNKQ